MSKLNLKVEVWDEGRCVEKGTLIEFSTYVGSPCGIIINDRGFLNHCYVRAIKVVSTDE